MHPSNGDYWFSTRKASPKSSLVWSSLPHFIQLLTIPVLQWVTTPWASIFQNPMSYPPPPQWAIEKAMINSTGVGVRKNEFFLLLAQLLLMEWPPIHFAFLRFGFLTKLWGLPRWLWEFLSSQMLFISTCKTCRGPKIKAAIPSSFELII